MNNALYRARGIYQGTGKESYLTSVWRKSRTEAAQDARMYGNRYSKIRIEAKTYNSFFNEINNGYRKRLPKK